LHTTIVHNTAPLRSLRRVAAVVVATAVVATVAAASKHQHQASAAPLYTPKKKAHSRSLRWVATATAGVSTVGTGVAAVASQRGQSLTGHRPLHLLLLLSLLQVCQYTPEPTQLVPLLFYQLELLRGRVPSGIVVAAATAMVLGGAEPGAGHSAR